MRIVLPKYYREKSKRKSKNQSNSKPNNFESIQRSRDAKDGSPLLKEAAKFGGDNIDNEMKVFKIKIIICQIKLNQNNMLSSKRTSKNKEGNSLLQNGRLDKDTFLLPSNSKKTSSTNIKHMHHNDKPSNAHCINQSSIAGKGNKCYIKI